MSQPYLLETKLFQFQVFLMQYQYSLRPTMDMNMNMNINIDHSCQYDGIDEDDVFYAEIRRQILLLTAEEEDEDYQETEMINSVSAGSSKPGSTRINLSSSLQYGNYFSSWETDKTNSVPTWLSNLWRNSNGTGVFIPHINKSRRRHRPGRMSKRKAYRSVEIKQS